MNDNVSVNDNSDNNSANGNRNRPAPEIARVSVRFPPFWRADPELWFSQIEAQFITSNITQDSTKYYHAIASVESDVLAKVSDLVKNPPTTDKYNTLKKRLINQFTDSENLKLKKVLSGIEFGDKRPSDILREMRNLAGSQLNDDVLKSLWMDGLPSQAQAILTVSDDNLDKLAVMADKIVENVSSKSILSITPNSVNNDDPRFTQLQQQIEALTSAIGSFSYRSRSHTPHHYRSRSKSNSRYKPGGKYCWYHFTFGKNSKKCTPPCSYSKKQENHQT